MPPPLPSKRAATAAPTPAAAPQDPLDGARTIPRLRPVGSASPVGAPTPSSPILVDKSTHEQLQQVAEALALRDEQVKARVVYYGAAQQTNSELDAITEQVVAELRALQMAAGGGPAPAPKNEPSNVEIELIAALRGLLEKLFSPQRTGFVKRKLLDVQRRITQLFFSSELYAEIAAQGGEVHAASWHEQALYYVLKQHEAAILADLEAMPVTDADVRAQAVERFTGFTRQLASDFLSRATPELERLLEVYRDSLTDFLYRAFPPELGEFCWEVVRESRVAQGQTHAYKIDRSKFDAFRRAFDRRFLEHLVLNVQKPISRRSIAAAGEFRDATLRFVNDPRIFSEICAAIDDAIYDYLHGEGFLDLPVDWRQHLHREKSAG